MVTKLLLARKTVFAAVLVITLSIVQVAYAVAPANDNFADAEEISSLPFNVSVDITDANLEPDEPQTCFFMERTVWHKFTPTETKTVRVTSLGSSVSTNINVYHATGPGISDLSALTCTAFAPPQTFLAEAGKTYYVQSGALFGEVGTISINLEEALPPANDLFANATVVGSLPFADSIDTAAATSEVGEPLPSCSFSGSASQSVWFSFTPVISGSVSAYVPTAAFTPVVAAYTGNSLNNLTEIGCRNFHHNRLTLSLTAGTTYFYQVDSLFSERGGRMEFRLEVTPPPTAAFSYSPFDPSVFDNIQFFNQSHDPGGAGFQTFAWDFGDGKTSTAEHPFHRYSKDGKYTVSFSVTTVDGRTASTSQVVEVKTHDVAITSISAPHSANSGQTRTITVSINNKRYTETVQVDLFKSTTGGFQWVGGYTQTVPVRPANRTTNFVFNYTFTADDAAIGKVTFKAIATITGARDALPADNELISSPPTKVTR